MLNRHNCVDALCNAGISHADAIALRRISMTLHRWHELECGNSDDYKSYCLVRGRKTREVLAGGAVKRGFEYAEDNEPWGLPHMETHYHRDTLPTAYHRVADRERGALKRLAAIMTRYPQFASYVQGDPRGCALYIMRPGDVREGASIDSCYSNGVAVCR
jgi:hypothetical protein